MSSSVIRHHTVPGARRRRPRRRDENVRRLIFRLTGSRVLRREANRFGLEGVYPNTMSAHLAVAPSRPSESSPRMLASWSVYPLAGDVREGGGG